MVKTFSFQSKMLYPSPRVTFSFQSKMFNSETLLSPFFIQFCFVDVCNNLKKSYVKSKHIMYHKNCHRATFCKELVIYKFSTRKFRYIKCCKSCKWSILPLSTNGRVVTASIIIKIKFFWRKNKIQFPWSEKITLLSQKGILTNICVM